MAVWDGEHASAFRTWAKLPFLAVSLREAIALSIGTPGVAPGACRRERPGGRAAAEDGQTALARIEALERPCLLVTDVMMPVMDGPHLLRALQQRNLLSTVTAVALSASDSVHQVQLANAFLPNPSFQKSSSLQSEV